MEATKGGSVFGFRQRLTNKLVEYVEQNDGAPWERGLVNMETRPFNPRSGTRFRGGNVLTLMLSQMERGSTDPRWMTLRQANDAGLRIRSQSKGTYIEYWDWGQQKSTQKHDSAVGAEIFRPKPFVSLMFNGEDVIGLAPLTRDIPWEPHALADKLIGATGARVDHTLETGAVQGAKDNVAYYSHDEDKIVMPPRASFKQPADYYATKLHELIHWTGHASRMARGAPDECNTFGSPEHAREELRAAIASMFLNSMLGVKGHVQDHAKYTRIWLETLKNDKHEIFRAARDAEKIVDHLFEYAPELREIVESTINDNLLPKSTPKPFLDQSIKLDLPNFAPISEAKTPMGTGRDDPRWDRFAQTVQKQADRLGLDGSVVDRAMVMVELSFSDGMNAAEERGFTSDDMIEMLTRSIMNELRMVDTRQQSWERFCSLVRAAGEGEHPPTQIEMALGNLGREYQTLVGKGIEEKWAPEETDKQVRALIYGDLGPRKITLDYVTAMLRRTKELDPMQPILDDDDDFVLMSRGANHGQELQEDLDVADDASLEHLMDDANTQERNECF